MEALIARAVQVLIALGGAYILTLWFAIVVWTFQDIQARSRSVVAQIFSTLVVLIFSIPGLLIYLILRPRYTLDDAFQRSLEEEYLMQDLEELPLCPGCQQYVEDDWVFCPNCRTELRDNCISCDQLIDLRWEICPFCGTEQYEDEDALPEPIVQPVMSPSPQYLGRPHLNPAEAFRLTESQEQTRPIIPATIRVDLRSGDVLTEPVPELPLSSPIRSLDGGGEPRRVSLDGNGYHSQVRESSDDAVDGGSLQKNDRLDVYDEQLVESDIDDEADSPPDGAAPESTSEDVSGTVSSTNENADDEASGPFKEESPERSQKPRKRRSRRKKSTTSGSNSS